MKLIFGLIFLLCVLYGCKKNTKYFPGNYNTYTVTGIVNGIGLACCNVHIKMLTGYDAITTNFTKVNIIDFGDSSVMSTHMIHYLMRCIIKATN